MHTYIYTDTYSNWSNKLLLCLYNSIYKNVNSCSTQLNNGFDKLFI